jgi:predicted transglutaminase-like cysteine proteinase
MASARILVFLAAIAALSGPGHARKVVLPFMPAGDLADAPAGFDAMCRRDTTLCALGGARDARPAHAITPTNGFAAPTGALRPRAASPAPRAGESPEPRTYQPVAAARTLDEAALAAALRQVNSQVNRHVVQMTDRDARGVDEYWMRLAPTASPVGDCEDIAIEKRIRLTEAGFPADRLFYGVAYLRMRGLHTVLIARLADGDYVLDSMTPRIERWQAKSYSWLRHQTPGRPMEWRRMDAGGEPRGLAQVPAPAIQPAPQTTAQHAAAAPDAA